MSWDDVLFRVEEIESTEVSTLLAALRQVYANGNVVLRSLRAENPAAFDHALRIDFQGTEKSLRTILTHATVVAGLPELRIEIPLAKPPEFRWSSVFGMEGDLTHMLLDGGAYERFRGTVEEARWMTRRFMESVFGTDLHRLWASTSSTPWTTWFYDIAWDTTFVVWDRQQRRFVLLCCTDTD